MATDTAAFASDGHNAGWAREKAEDPELLRLLVANLKDCAIIMLDPKGNVLTWSSAAEQLKGWKASEIIGQHFSRFYPAEDVQKGKTGIVC